ncbi:MAG: hypothetical protein AB7H80_16910 [Candidatus Kapaibacterium sp.]
MKNSKTKIRGFEGSPVSSEDVTKSKFKMKNSKGGSRRSLLEVESLITIRVFQRDASAALRMTGWVFSSFIHLSVTQNGGEAGVKSLASVVEE